MLVRESKQHTNGRKVKRKCERVGGRCKGEGGGRGEKDPGDSNSRGESSIEPATLYHKKTKKNNEYIHVSRQPREYTHANKHINTHTHTDANMYAHQDRC